MVLVGPYDLFITLLLLEGGGNKECSVKLLHVDTRKIK